MNKNKLLKILLGISLGYCLLLLLAGPLVLKPLLIKQSQKHLQGSLQLESLWINPLTHSVTLENLSIINNNEQALASLEHIYINIDILPLILLNARIKDFRADQLRLFTTKEGADAWLNLNQLSISQLDAALLKNEISINNISLATLSLKPKLYKDKQNNVEIFLGEVKQLLDKKADSEAPEKKQAESSNKDKHSSEKQNLEHESSESSAQESNKDWLLNIQRIQVSNSDILFENYNLANEQNDTNTSQSISNISIDIESIYSDFRDKVLLAVNMDTLKGQIEIKGEINPATLTSEFNYSLKDIQLEQLNNYIEYYSLASLESGLINSSGTITTSEVENSQEQKTEKSSNKLIIKLSNQTTIEKLIIAHQQFDEPLLLCQFIDSNALKLSMGPENELKKLMLDTLLIDQCQLSVVLLKEGSHNLKLTRANAETKTESSQPTQQKSEGTAKQKPLPINIREIRLNQNSIQIKDLTQGKVVTTNISELNLLLSDIAEGSVDKTKLDLTATVNNHAPLSLTGTGNFINPEISANTVLQLTRLGLSDFSPYTLALSSRPIEKGVLSLKIETHIQENQLNSDNKVSIEGIKMGKRQNHENAGNLPLALAITVLRDKNGKLDFDIPIQGDLDDPEFNIRKQIIRSLSGLINKAATAPLNIVGGLISGDNTQARIITFEENSSSVNETAAKQAGKIADTLKKKAELALSLTPVLSETETQGLSEQQQSDLLSARLDAFEKVLIDSGLAGDQIDKSPIDINNVNQQGGLEIRFFAR